MRKSLATVVTGGILSLALLSAVQAAGPKPGEVAEYRQAVFNIVGWNFKPIGAMVKGEIPFDAAAVVRHAEYIAMLSQTAPEGFAKGSGPDVVKDTEAKAEIWTKPDEFNARMKEFQDESAGLLEAAKGGDEGAIKAQFAKAAETCKACHKAFRKD